MRFWSLAAVGAASLLSCASAHAQDARTVYLYSSSLGTAQGAPAAARPNSWGNGTARVTRRGVEYEGGSVLEVATTGFAEGARFDLTQPLDIDPYIDRGFFRMRVRFQSGGGGFGGGGFGGGFGGRGGFRGAPLIRPQSADSQTADAVPMTSMTPAWSSNAQFQPVPQFGGAPGGFGGQGGGFPGGGFPGGFPGGEGGEAPVVIPQRATATELRVTMLRENGAMTGRIKIDLNRTQPDANGWRLFTIPIKQFSMTRGASGPVRRVLITADKEDTIYIAQAAIGIETGQMTVSIRRPSDAPGTQNAEIEVKPGPISLVADVEAGSADAEVTWNFDADNAGNITPPANGDFPGGGFPGGFPGGMRPGMEGAMGGMMGPGMEGAPAIPVGPRIDARGLSATFTYPNEEQNYRVEVTVTDKSGAKKPVTASVIVKVRG